MMRFLLALWAVAVLAGGCGSESGGGDGGPVTFAPGDTGQEPEGDGSGGGPDSVGPADPDVGDRSVDHGTGGDEDQGPVDDELPVEPPPDVAAEQACEPDCVGKECGEDGCGGQCGFCPAAAPLCVGNLCLVQCLPDCEGKECGENGCGGQCGDCPPGLPDCVDGHCQLICQPDCAGKECGEDGCGGQCGLCPAVAPLCENFKCALECFPDCTGKACGSDGCGGSCGECPPAKPLCQQGVCKAEPGPDDGCTEEGKQVFLVTEAKWLLRFEPATKTIVPIGQLNCNAAWGETPYSMSVDRNSFAWVLYGDGTLWKVDTKTASCQATAFLPNQLGFEIFGMGFSTDSPDVQDETLYIAGGDYWDAMYGDATLGSIDLKTLKVTSIAPFPAGSGLPELTGNRSAELWGFFPKTSPPRIAAINKKSALLMQAFLLPPSLFANVQAWAFAHWGGDFYIFFKSGSAVSSGIWRVSTSSGEVESVLAATGHVITGAGVSTCAPVDSEE